MSVRKLTASLTIGFAVAYLACATVDVRWNISGRLASKLAQFV